MANQQQKGNQIFGQNYMQKFCIAESDEVSDRSDEHRSAVQKISRQSSQDVGRELSTNGNGPIAAINAVIAKAGDLADKGEIDATAAADVKTVLETLKERVKEQRRKDAEEKKSSVKVAISGGKQQVQWRLDEEPPDPVVTSLDQYCSDFHGKFRADRELVFSYLESAKWAGQQWQDFLTSVRAGITKRELANIMEANLAEARANRP